MRAVSRSTLWRILAIGLPVLAALAAPLPSVDLTFQLRAGSEILASRAIPAMDSWTFTAAGQPWLDQQWGSQVLLQLIYGATGWAGLVLLRASLVGLAFGLLLATVRRQAPGLGSIGSTLVVIAAFVVTADALALRAQLFAIVLFAGTLYILAVRDERPRSVWLVPVIAAAWANIHGTFLFVPALCGLAWLADLYEQRGRTVHRMLIVGLVATAATLINPFGPAAWGYVATLTSNPTIASRVSEWQPPSPTTVPGALLWLSVLGVAALAAVRVRRAWRSRDTTGPRRSRAFGSSANIPWPALLTLALFGGFALASGRGTAWWPFAAAFVIAPWLLPNREGVPAGSGAAVTAPEPRPTPPLLRRLNVAIVALLALVAVALLPTWRPPGPAGVPNGTLSYAPQGIAHELVRLSFLSDTPRPGPSVWNPQVWGSWLEFAAPGYRYALDSRIELFGASVWADADAISAGTPAGLAALDRYQVDAVVTDPATDSELERVLGLSSEWVRTYVDCDGSIWGRRKPGVPAGNGPAPLPCP